MRYRTTIGRMLLVAAVGLLTLAPASQGALFPTAQDLNDGREWATSSIFDSVLQMTTFQDGNAVSSATSILLSPDWMLSISELHFSQPFDSLRFLSGPDPFGSGPGHTRWASEWYSHPLASSQPISGVDLMLVRLSEPILDIAPAPLFMGAPALGMEFVAAGYGRPGSVEMGMLPPDWNRRAGRNAITRWTGGYALSEFTAPGEPGHLPLEWRTTPGDSGGAWFVEVGGELQLMAVNSFQVGWFDSYGTLSGAMPIYSHVDWIHGITGLPEPSSLALVIVGSLLLRQRRSFR